MTYKDDNKPLHIRMTEAEHAQLRKDAFHHEMTIADYVRWLITEQRKREENS